MDIRTVPAKNKAPGTTAPVISPTVGTDNHDQATKPISMPDSSASETIDPTNGDMDAFRADLYADGVEDALLFKILDTIITEGNYTWEFNVFNKIPCAFQVRPDWVRQEVVRILEEKSPKTMAGFTDLVNRHNLAGSLTRMGDTKLNVGSLEDLEEALKFLSGLSFITVNALVRELAKFDKVVAVATSPWALENFIEPRSEK